MILDLYRYFNYYLKKVDFKYLKKHSIFVLLSVTFVSKPMSALKNENRDFYPRHRIPKLRESRFLCRKHDTRMHLGSTPVTLTRRTNKANASHESRSESARYALVIQPARLSAVSDDGRTSPATFVGIRESPRCAGAVGSWRCRCGKRGEGSKG